MFDGKVSLWQGGDAEPFVAVPADSPNARLLLTVVSRSLPKERPEATDPDGLGRILFRKTASRLLWILLAVFVLIFPVTMGSIALSEHNVGLGVGALVVAGLLLVGVIVMPMSKFECHEHGLRKRGLFGERTLRYGDIAAFSYSAVRHYHNGAYVGTNIAMSFAPSTGKALKVGKRVTGTDADLDYLRDRVAQMVFARLYGEVKSGETVACGSARLAPDGIHYRKAKLLGEGEASFASYRDVRYSVADGVLHLFVSGRTKADARIACSVANFYPCAMLLDRLIAEAGA
jgi:hypothetical protein